MAQTRLPMTLKACAMTKIEVIACVLVAILALSCASASALESEGNQDPDDCVQCSVNQRLAEARDKEELTKALKRFEANGDFNGLIPVSVVNDSIKTWIPPMETLYIKTVDEDVYSDPETEIVQVIYEMIQNASFYGLDEVIEDVLSIANQSYFAPALFNMMAFGLPSKEEILVNMWETGFVNDLLDEIQRMLLSKSPEEYKKMFSNTISGVVEVTLGLLSEPDSMLWKDFAVIVGEPLGPAILIGIKSPIFQEAIQDKSAIIKSAQDNPSLEHDVEILGAKTLLFNPYFPVPCLRGEASCPEEEKAVWQTTRAKYDAARKGEISIEQFIDTSEGKLLGNISKQLGLSNFKDFLLNLFSNQNQQIVAALSHKGAPDNEEFYVLNNVSAGTYSLEIGNKLAEDVGFNSGLAVCMANISATVYEGPDVIQDWIEGLGLQLIDTFVIGGSLSVRAVLLLDNRQNAIILGIEGTPYTWKYFFRGLFGWLQDLLSSRLIPYPFPCSEEANLDPDMCRDMERKYGNASVYQGFHPDIGNNSIAEEILPPLAKLLNEINEETLPAFYVTGHSLGGAIAKNALVELLIRGYSRSFRSMSAYTYAAPFVGNDAYLNMTEDLLSLHNSTLFQVINLYDVVPYLPTFFNASHGNRTLLYNVSNNEVEEINTAKSSYKSVPDNIDMPNVGFHSMLAQYLPLTRSIEPSKSEQCEVRCDLSQCGLFKCRDTCLGFL